MTKEDKIESKVGAKKRKKESELFSAAYELFTTKGMHNTAIDDIVKKAGVAKGTFYLYFKDKYDILNRLILQKSTAVIREALEETEKKSFDTFDDKLLFFMDYIINFFTKNKLMLKLINKNFSWGIYRKAIMKPEQNKEVEIVVKKFIDALTERNMDLQEAELTLFMVFELVGAVCYSSIILEEPTDIETIKPILFKKVLAIIR